MLNSIEFKDKRFETKDDFNLLSPLTKNTIIICNNCKIMDTLTEEIINTVNGRAEYNDYECDNEDVGCAKLVWFFGLQRLIDINGQRITLALEPAIVYKAKSIDDIWLFECKGKKDTKSSPYKEFIYPMTIFKGSNEIWNMGKDEVYKTICSGRYGTYDGNWII